MSALPDIDQVRAFAASAGITDEFVLEPVRVEASARRYFRLRSNGQGQDLILAVQPPFTAADDDFLVLSRFLFDRNLPVPRILATDEQRGWVLQSDGGTGDLAAWLKDHPPTPEHLPARRTMLTETLDLLARLHDVPLPEPVAARRFDYEKLWWEMEYLLKEIRLLCDRHGAPSPLSFELEMFLQEVCAALEHEADRTGEVFTHRDFHTRNLLHADGRLTMIDYQDARRGLAWYDLASLLWDPYTEFTNEERQFAYEYYIERTGRGGKRAHDMYFAQALQRIFKALGTYLFQTYERQLDVFYPSIGAALGRIEEIAQRGFFPDSVYLFVRHFQEGLLPLLPRPAGVAP